MTRRIVVPVNESAQSERALPVAAALARRLGASIALVSAVGWPNWDYPGHAGYHESLMAPYPDLDAESIVVKSKSDAATAIRAVCGADDIICLGAGHTSAMSELLLRSVFFDLVRDFHGPVVAVGPHATMPDGAGRMLLCVDGHARAEQGLHLVEAFAEPAGLSTFIVQAVGEQRHGSPVPADASESGYVHALAQRISSAHPVDWEVLHGEPVNAIGDFANDPAVALVALATDAIDPIGRIISPSVANALLDRCPRPLVLLGTTDPITVTRHAIRRVAGTASRAETDVSAAPDGSPQ